MKVLSYIISLILLWSTGAMAFAPGFLQVAGGGGEWTPADLFKNNEAGVWYDVSDISTLFQDTSGTTPVTASGQSVRKMLDKSGRGNHMTFSGTTPPLYVLDSKQVPCIYPSGSATARGVNSSLSLSGATTGIIAARVILDSDNKVLLDSYDNTTGRFTMTTKTSTTNSLAMGGSNALENFWYTGRFVFTNLFDGSSSKLRVGGNTLQSGSLTVGAYTGLSMFDLRGNPTPIAASYTDTVSYFYGMIIRDGALSASTISLAENYIGKKIKSGAGEGIAYFIGDSTTDFYSTYAPMFDYLDTNYPIAKLATVNETTAQQKTRWDNDDNVSFAKYVVIQIGLNDLGYAEAASVAIARIQALVDSVASLAPSAQIIVSQMTPCRARLISLYGETNGEISYQKWLSMNEAIAGNGANPITGVDGRVTSHVAQLNDGNGNLASFYDHGDGIHTNTAGRTINATSIAAVLSSLGVL